MRAVSLSSGTQAFASSILLIGSTIGAAALFATTALRPDIVRMVPQQSWSIATMGIFLVVAALFSLEAFGPRTRTGDPAAVVERNTRSAAIKSSAMALVSLAIAFQIVVHIVHS